jgi:hypothetical protein
MVKVWIFYKKNDMEQSRYQQYHRLYILGFFCLLFGFFFLGMSIYLAPLVIFNYNVDVPTSYFELTVWLQDTFFLSEVDAGWMILEICFALGLLFLVIAQIVSNYIDNHLLKYHKVEDPQRLLEKEKDLVEVKHMVLILLVAILLVLVGLKIFEATISSVPPNAPIVAG